MVEFVDIVNVMFVEVFNVFNFELVGVLVDLDGGDLWIMLDRWGIGLSVEIMGGTAAAVFGFFVGVVSGIGNVVNIDVVFGFEVEMVFEVVFIGGGGVLVMVEMGGEIIVILNMIGVFFSIQIDVSLIVDDEFGFDNVMYLGGLGVVVNMLQVDGKD